MTRFILIVVLCLLPDSHAKWMRVETTPIPVDRVLTNLTNRAATETNNFELIHAIARLHSLSYSRGASNWVVDISTNTPGRYQFTMPGQTSQLPWFGYGPSLPPKTVVPASNSADKVAASKHLLDAIQSYQRAVRLQPTNDLAYIGLGWCQIQAGQTNEAKATLRRGIQLAWQHEKTQQVFFYEAVTVEAIDYLLPVLDTLKDAAEIKQLSDLKTKAERMSSRRAITPLVFPLQLNLSHSTLINTNASIAFDLDGSANPNRRWQWITTNAAWIVHLPQGGRVTSALQMFGNVTFWMFWENGYHALASLDDNADGLLSGEELRGIRLWLDRNSDGICDSNEILELSQLGLTALDTRYTNQNHLLTSPSGAQFIDGSTRPTYDIILQSQ